MQKLKGTNLCYIDDLQYMTKKDRDLVPVIIKHIKLVDPINLKLLLLRGLAKRGLYGASAFLLNEFKTCNDKDYCWSIGNALEIIKDPNISAELLEIALDASYGIGRQRIVAALGVYRGNPEVRKALIRLLSDKDVTGHALEGLKKCGEMEDIPYIEPYLNHKMTWIRREAERAMKQIKKRHEKDLEKRTRPHLRFCYISLNPARMKNIAGT